MMGILPLLEMQGAMLLFLLAGLVMRKKDVLSENGKAVLTNLLVDFILPCSIIHSFQVPFSEEVFSKCLAALVIAAGIQVFAFAISKIFYRSFDRTRRGILEYGTICSNAGMMGTAIAESVYGEMGMLYASLYLIPQRIAMWTIGLTCFEQAVSRKDMVKKVLLHPCIIAVEIGLIVMLGRIPVPGFVSDTLDMAGGCTTPLSMLFLGMVLAEIQHLRDMLDRQVLFYAAVRLVAFPAAVFAACRLLSADPLVTGVSVLLSAMPAGSTVAVLASKYRQDTDFSTKCVVITTLFSLVTIPVWCGILAFV